MSCSVTEQQSKQQSIQQSQQQSNHPAPHTEPAPIADRIQPLYCRHPPLTIPDDDAVKVAPHGRSHSQQVPFVPNVGKVCHTAIHACDTRCVCGGGGGESVCGLLHASTCV